MSTPPTVGAFEPEDRRQHLDHIQGVITRLSQASATAKGWSLTIAGAAFGFATLNQRWYLSFLGLAVIISFSILDMNYLYQERLFRCLYRGAAANVVAPYDMDKDRFRSQASRRRTYVSWSVLGFYLPLTVAGGFVVAVAFVTH